MQYHSECTPENENEQVPTLSDNYPFMLEIHVTINGTDKLLKNLHPSKVTGSEEIPARILKQFAIEFAPHITFIFNISFKKGEVT